MSEDPSAAKVKPSNKPGGLKEDEVSGRDEIVLSAPPNHQSSRTLLALRIRNIAPPLSQSSLDLPQELGRLSNAEG